MDKHTIKINSCEVTGDRIEIYYDTSFDELSKMMYGSLNEFMDFMEDDYPDVYSCYTLKEIIEGDGEKIYRDKFYIKQMVIEDFHYVEVRRILLNFLINKLFVLN